MNYLFAQVFSSQPFLRVEKKTTIYAVTTHQGRELQQPTSPNFIIIIFILQLFINIQLFIKAWEA